MDILQTIDKLNNELKLLSPLKLEFQQKLEKKLRLEFNYNSNHLEGNTLTYGETELLLMFDKADGKHELRELEEMKAHDVAYEIIKEWAKDVERPLNENAIKNLNGVLLVRPFWKDAITPDGQSTRRLIKVGDYKEYPNSVRLQNGEIFHYASPEETSMLMGDLVEWYRVEEEKKELHPVVLAAHLHYKFVRIHPFDDGNGRISRLIMNYVLLKHHLPPIIIKSADKKNYLFALNQADSGDLDAFTKYIANQLIWSLELSLKAANGESLDEEDDLEKEIAVWKRGLADQPDMHPKSISTILELYKSSLRPLFQLFVEKNLLFKELFLDTAVMVSANSEKKYLELSSLDIVMHDYSLEHDKWLNNQDQEEVEINTLNVVVFFQKFKKSGTNAFNHLSELVCKFDELEWLVTSGNKTIRKLYSQSLPKTEIQEFVRESIKNSFSSIQNKIKL